jgi:hypothetical protein
MKKLLLLAGLLISSFSIFAQAPSIGHFQQLATVKRGDTLEVAWYYQPVSNTDIRTFQVDFQYRKQLLTHISTTVASTYSGQTPYVDYQQFNNYKYGSYTNGTYNYVADTNWTVARNYLILASGNAIASNSYIIYNKYKINDVPSNFASDTVTVNWARLFKVDGTSIGDNIANLTNKKLAIYLKGNFTIYGKVWLATNMTTKPTVVATDYNTGAIASSVVVNNDGTYTLPNIEEKTKYKISVLFPQDSLVNIRDYAVTITDGTKAYDEFTKTDVSQQYSRLYLKSGLSYLQADINKTGTFDGGDAYGIYASVSGLKKIDTANLISVFHANEYDSLVLGSNQWTAWANYINRGNFVIDSVGTTNLDVQLKYFILGDVNRSHSSPVFNSTGGEILAYNIIGNMDVNVPDTYTGPGQPLVVPFNVSFANNKQNAGLQFEMKYDPSKVKFEEIISNIQGPWLQYVTHDEVNGIVRFGGVNNQTSGFLSGNSTPFRLKFSPIGNNDITSNIYIRRLMDAADINGDPFAISLVSDKVTISNKAMPGFVNGNPNREITAKVFPNPSNGMFELVVDFPQPNMFVMANVYDFDGNLIKRIGKLQADEYLLTAQTRVEMPGARAGGSYFVSLQSPDGQAVTKKLLIL